MKFAFSTVSCPAWDFATIAAKAKELGYSGVEIRGFLHEPAKTSADVFKDSAGVKKVFADAGIEIACLSSSIAMTRDRKKNAMLADDLRRFIDTAAELACPRVLVRDTVFHSGQSTQRTAHQLGEWLAPFGDLAAERNITIVVENAITYRKAGELWMVLEGANHPSIQAAWDVFTAAQAGEGPSVSVPTLNARIGYVQVKDAKLSKEGATLCKLGEGDVQVQRLVTRLMGIGYKGVVTVEWDKAFVPTLAEPEEILPAAIEKLKDWTKPPVSTKPVKKEVLKKEPAAPVAKPETAKEPVAAKA